jgi:hypothetical protein
MGQCVFLCFGQMIAESLLDIVKRNHYDRCNNYHSSLSALLSLFATLVGLRARRPKLMIEALAAING